MNPRHLALLLPELEAGGAQRVMLLLAREFAARGHRVDLVLLQARGPLLAEIPAGVRLVDLGARTRGTGGLGFLASSVRRLAAWLRRERPETLLSTITGANLAAVLARELTGVKVRLVLREAGSILNIRSRVRLAAMRRLYPRADQVIALSPVMAEHFVTRIGIPAQRVAQIANPVDLPRLARLACAPLQHPWFDEHSQPVIVSAGRLIPEKDYATLLHAFALVPPGTRGHLIIVGEGPERPQLEALADTLAIQNDIAFVGFDANPWRWMVRADLFVLSSRSEGHPNALLEALALGLPAVITEYDASAREFGNTAGTSLVPVADPRRLAAAIGHALSGARPEAPRPPPDISPAIDAYLALL